MALQLLKKWNARGRGWRSSLSAPMHRVQRDQWVKVSKMVAWELATTVVNVVADELALAKRIRISELYSVRWTVEWYVWWMTIINLYMDDFVLPVNCDSNAHLITPLLFVGTVKVWIKEYHNSLWVLQPLSDKRSSVIR